MKAPFEPRLIYLPHCCDDREVRRFVEAEMLNFYSTYTKLTAKQAFDAARAAFGDVRCDSLTITVH